MDIKKFLVNNSKYKKCNEHYIQTKSLNLIFEIFNVLNIKKYQKTACYYFMFSTKQEEIEYRCVEDIISLILTSIDLTIKIKYDEVGCLMAKLQNLIPYIRKYFGDFDTCKIDLIKYIYVFTMFILDLDDVVDSDEIYPFDNSNKTLKRYQITKKIFCNPYFILFTLKELEDITLELIELNVKNCFENANIFANYWKERFPKIEKREIFIVQYWSKFLF